MTCFLVAPNPLIWAFLYFFLYFLITVPACIQDCLFVLPIVCAIDANISNRLKMKNHFSCLICFHSNPVTPLSSIRIREGLAGLDMKKDGFVFLSFSNIVLVYISANVNVSCLTYFLYMEFFFGLGRPIESSTWLLSFARNG